MPTGSRPKLSSAPREPLTARQRAAIDVVRERATAAWPAARALVRAILHRHGVDENAYAAAVNALRGDARIALHFHPERLSRARESVAAGLLQSGVYKNQFETGLSSGSPSAFAGGERDLWELRLFAGAYHVPHATRSERPKYGSLVVVDHADGPSPRFGSCYFLLRPEVAQRATFTWGGSQEDEAPERTATLDLLELTMAPLLAHLERGEGALGLDDLTVPGLPAILHDAGASREAKLGRALDSFIEAQVHGELLLSEDVERLVCDPAFRGHPIGDLLAQLAAQHGIALSWHPGFTLPASEVPDVFRDFPVRPLAERVVEGTADAVLDAAKIGDTANSLVLQPEAWTGWAQTHDDVLTQFRRLWHVLVLFGSTREP